MMMLIPRSALLAAFVSPQAPLPVPTLPVPTRGDLVRSIEAREALLRDAVVEGIQLTSEMGPACGPNSLWYSRAEFLASGERWKSLCVDETAELDRFVSLTGGGSPPRFPLGVAGRAARRQPCPLRWRATAVPQSEAWRRALVGLAPERSRAHAFGAGLCGPLVGRRVALGSLAGMESSGRAP